MARQRLVTKQVTLTTSAVFPNTAVFSYLKLNEPGTAFRLAQVKCTMISPSENADDEYNTRLIQIYNQVSNSSGAGTANQLVHQFSRVQYKYTQTAVGVNENIDLMPLIWNPPASFVLYGDYLRVVLDCDNTAIYTTANITFYGYETKVSDIEKISQLRSIT